MTLRSVFAAALAVVVTAVGTASSRAGNLYTFEAPFFTLGESTPIGPTAPNSGDPGFRTSFAAAGDPGAAFIESGFPSPLFSGQFLVTEAPGLLTLTFNQPVYGLSVAFGLEAPAGDPLAYLELVAGTTTYDQSNTSPGGPFAGGTLTFSSGTPFTTATLEAFAGPGVPTLFAIDNLDLTTASVPEPSSIMLLGVGLTGLVAVARRRRKS
jgi:hypothetical protein